MRELLYETVAYFGAKAGFGLTGKPARILGGLLWRLVPSRRRLAVNTIAERLGLPRPEAERIARESFDHNARSFLEILATDRVDWRFEAERVRVVGREHLEYLQRTKRPVVCTTAHFGAWEVLAGLLGLYFPGRERAAVVRRPKDHALHELMMHRRRRPGVDIYSHRNAAIKVLRLLRKNGMVAFLVDHNCMRDEAVFLPFLGKVAAVNVGPALLAVRGKALVQPAFLHREGRDYVLTFPEAPLDTTAMPDDGDRGRRITAVADFYTRAVERMVRAHPEQWFWMHKRWKTRPPDENPG